MKNILCYILILFALPCLAQNPLYLQPALGAGFSNCNISDVYGEGPSKNMLAYDVSLGLGYQFKRFILSSGIGYMRTGRQSEYNYYTSVIPHNSIDNKGQKTEYYHHVVIPLYVGFNVPLSKRFSFIISIGIDVSYNPRVVYIASNDPAYSFTSYFNVSHSYTSGDSKQFNTFTAWGTAKTELVYTINPHLGLTVGPAVHYMLSSMVKPGTKNTYFDFPLQMHNYACLLNVGLKVKLKSKAPAPTAEATRQD